MTQTFASALQREMDQKGYVDIHWNVRLKHGDVVEIYDSNEPDTHPKVVIVGESTKAEFEQSVREFYGREPRFNGPYYYRAVAE